MLTASGFSDGSEDDSYSWLWVAGVLMVCRAVVEALTILMGKDDYRSILCRYLLFIEVQEHLANQICPRRRARYLKCAKRCDARRRKAASRQGHEDQEEPRCSEGCRRESCCMIGCRFIKLHLPPPLPFFRGKKTKQSCEQSCPCPGEFDASMEDSSSSSSLEDEALPKRAPPVLRPSATALMDMARMQQWNALLVHVDRRGAKHRDKDGLYPLQWACAGSAPVAVVRALLDAYPAAAHRVDSEGSTALHFATHYAASSAVIEAVLKAYPKAIRMQDKYGRTPLYHAVEKGLGLEVLKLLVETDASCILLSCVAKDKRHLPLTREVAVRTPLYVAWASAARDRQSRRKCRGRQWDKAEYLLTVASGRQNVLEALIAMDLYLPEQTITVMLSARPELMTGSTALMTAASTVHYSRERALHLIRLVVQQDPGAAAGLGADGRSVLARAVDANQPWECIRELLRASPYAIARRDPVSALPPAFLAATSMQPVVMLVSPKQGWDPDPYKLLSCKQKELEGLSMMIPHIEGNNTSSNPCSDPNLLHLNTIYMLLQLDPSVVFHHGYCLRSK